MRVTIDFGYDQIFELVQQLSPEERVKLTNSLQSPELEPEPKRKMSKEEYHEFLMNGPVLGEEEIQLMLDAKKAVDQCRPISF